MTFSFFFAAASCSMVFWGCLVLAHGIRKLAELGGVAVSGDERGPRVTVVVPACNEEENIERAVLALLSQNYSNLEVLVVNDRSCDGTAGILGRLQATHPHLRIHEVGELPDGWMGKSHALARGADLATGDYLLFTDADVVLEPTTISRAMRFTVDNRLDHLALIFRNLGGGWLLNCLILEMAMGLLFFFRPWRLGRRGSRDFIGIGAFNLVKKSTYEKIGGHATFRLHPIDDLMLGRIIMEQGFRQGCLLAHGFVTVPWYPTVRAMVAGLEKNIFAFFHYRLAFIPPVLALLVLVNILPLWGAILCDGPSRFFWMFALILKLSFFFCGLLYQRLPSWYLAGALITPYLVVYIVLRSTIVVWKNGGIRWRGRFYHLSELKKSRKLFF